MNENIYNKAYTEIIEILKHMPEESVNKLPKELLTMFQTKMDKNYNFKIDITKSFNEQTLLNETKAILANIFRDYWATPYQKERIIAKENYERQQLEEEKRKLYNPNNLFKKTTNNIPIPQKNISTKKENFFNKLINFIKNIKSRN